MTYVDFRADVELFGGQWAALEMAGEKEVLMHRWIIFMLTVGPLL